MVSGEKSAVRWINSSPECIIHLVFLIYLWLSAAEGVEQQELSGTAGGNAKRCSQFGRHVGDFLPN